MVKKTADDAARELLFATERDREAHAAALEALLARNASLRTNDELVDGELRADPDFHAEWDHTALGRAAAIAIVRYRAEHDLSQEELAVKLGVTTAQITELEVGEANSNADMLHTISAQLGIALRPVQ